MFASRLECRSISNKVVGKIVADMKKFEFTANVMTNTYSIILIIACIYCYGITCIVMYLRADGENEVRFCSFPLLNIASCSRTCQWKLWMTEMKSLNHHLVRDWD